MDDWSNLGEGMVLVPMIQRALQEGAARFGLAANKICGDTTALAEARGEDPWHRVDDTHGSKWIAGIYRSGQRWVALNRSPDEDQPETIDQAVVKKLLDPVTVDVFDASVANTNRLSSEIWRVCLGGVLVMLLIEALLLWPGLRKKGGGEAGGSGYQTLRGVVK